MRRRFDLGFFLVKVGELSLPPLPPSPITFPLVGTLQNKKVLETCLVFPAHWQFLEHS